jgi:uncharacterized protein (TIGR02466 family)
MEEVSCWDVIMNFVNIFPSIIGYNVDKQFTDKILPFANEYLAQETRVTYTWNYKNTYGNDYAMRDNNLNFIKKRIYDMCSEYLQSQHKVVPKSIVIQLFFSEMDVDDHHEEHCHPNCILSGILYLKVPDNSAPIIFHDRSPHRDYVYIDNIDDTVDLTKYTIPPKDGLMLIWPSWMRHQVPLNKSNSRITCVFNVISLYD